MGMRDCRDAALAEPCCRDIARVSTTFYSIRKVAGLGENGGAGITKSELAERLASGTGMSKAAAKDAVDGVFEAIGEAQGNGEEARILGLGTFGTRNRPARTARNLRTGESVSITASTVPVFKAGKTLKNAVGSGES